MGDAEGVGGKQEDGGVAAAAAEEEGCPSREGKIECGREEEECKKERREKKGQRVG